MGAPSSALLTVSDWSSTGARRMELRAFAAIGIDLDCLTGPVPLSADGDRITFSQFTVLICCHSIFCLFTAHFCFRSLLSRGVPLRHNESRLNEQPGWVDRE